MMDKVKESVKDFYNLQASKFSWTRKKQWPEFFYIKEEVSKILETKWKIKILELGCGDGRLFRFLDSYFPDKIEYIWVDISEQLINIAKDSWESSSNSSTFIVDDMLSFLEKQDQQSFDMVVAVASFQHINKKYERILILKNIYRILEYDGVVLMFNWSFSSWFFKKFKKQIFKAFVIWILSLFTYPLNDIYVPWKNEWKTYYRYYHIFFLFELKNLFKLSSFVIKELCYINRNWNKSVSWMDSRNSFVLAKKTTLKIK